MCIGGYVIRKWYLKNEIILLKRNRITFDHWSDTATIIIFFPMKLFINKKNTFGSLSSRRNRELLSECLKPYLHRLFNLFFILFVL